MSSHDKDHVERVVKIAEYIAKKEGADLKIVLKAAELHDIARSQADHASKSAEIARNILKKEGYSKEFIEKVAHAIEAHSFSKRIKLCFLTKPNPSYIRIAGLFPSTYNDALSKPSS